MCSVPGAAALEISRRVALHPQLFKRMESMGAPVAAGSTLSPLCASISATRNDSKTVTKRPLSIQEKEKLENEIVTSLRLQIHTMHKQNNKMKPEDFQISLAQQVHGSFSGTKDFSSGNNVN